MKDKSFPLFVVFSLIAGVLGAYFRASQVMFAYDHAFGILKSGEPSTYALAILSIVVMAVAVFAVMLLKKGAATCGNNTPLRISLILAAVIVLAYTAMMAISLRDGFEIIVLVLVLLSVYAAISLVVFARYNLEERSNPVYCVFSAVPAVWACFMLILLYRDKSTNPVISSYVFTVLAYIAILLFCYALCAHLLGKDKRCIAILSCISGCFFILINLLSPLFAGGFIEVNTEWITEALPQLAFLILMPISTARMIKK